MSEDRLPTTYQEFHDRYKSNERIENEGTPQAVVHMPCMFCGAPDFFVLRALQVQEDLSKGTKCVECGRSVVVVFGPPKGIAESVSYEVFQYAGDDPPEYLPSKPRRVT